MKKRHTVHLLVLCWLVTSTPIFAQKAAQKLKNGPNLSINLTDTKEGHKTSYLNIGLTSNIFQLKGIGVNVLSSIVHTQMTGFQLAGLANITGMASKGIQIAGAANVTGQNATGLQIGGLMNVAGKAMNGVQLSTIGNVAGQTLNGLTIGGLINMAGKTANGVQIAGLANFSGEETKGIIIGGLMNVSAGQVKGMQLSAITNIAVETLKGLQLAGAVNIAVNTEKSLQWSALANITQQQMSGVQVALGNYAGHLKGAQIGVLNMCGGNVKGVQIGLINHSKDTTTLKIGLVNINPQTRIQMLSYGGNRSKINIAARFLNHHTYTILGVGTHYLGLNENFSGCLFYRAGLYYPIMSKVAISGDLGFYHIESFDNEDAEIPERMYSIQPRVNFEYHISHRLGIMASGGYAWTRHYDKDKMYEHKPIIELGIILF